MTRLQVQHMQRPLPPTQRSTRRHTLNVISGYDRSAMSSLSDITVPPEPADENEARIIAKMFGASRKPTTVALSFRNKLEMSPKQNLEKRRSHLLPKLPLLPLSPSSKPKETEPCGGRESDEVAANCPTLGLKSMARRHTLHTAGGVTSGQPGNNSTSALRDGVALTKATTNSTITSNCVAGKEPKCSGELPATSAAGSKCMQCRKQEMDMVGAADCKSPTVDNTSGLLHSPCGHGGARLDVDVPNTATDLKETSRPPVTAANDVTPVTVAYTPRLISSKMPPDVHSSQPSVVLNESSTNSRPIAANSDSLPPSSSATVPDVSATAVNGHLLPPKPCLYSLFNTQNDIVKFRQLLRESTDEAATENRINYCTPATTARIEAWLAAVRAARFDVGGLCRVVIDESLESEKNFRQASASAAASGTTGIHATAISAPLALADDDDSDDEVKEFDASKVKGQRS